VAIVLFRVDDRLIHGQVVVGWGRPFGVNRVVLVDDQVAASPWEQDLYRMAVTPDIEVEFDSIVEAASRLRDWQSEARRTLVLTGDIETMAALHRADPVTVHRINLGGIHHKAGRRERLPYLYLTDEEMMRLEALEAAGAAVSAQDLPTTAPVTLKALA
jgi:mannose/fructose/N-acetylgalactosamine-specific phosphotransferase system component IIB